MRKCKCGCGEHPLVGRYVRGHWWRGRRRADPLPRRLPGEGLATIRDFRPAREELAWAAGLYDGEGSTFSNGKTPPMMTINQSGSPEVLKRFQSAVGGLGRIYGPRQVGSPGRNQPRWDWKSCSFEHAQAIMAMLWPFLSSVKRTQMDGAFGRYAEWRKIHPHDGGDIIRTCECGRELRGVAFFRHRTACQRKRAA